jgi:hypothetical protein
MAKFPDTVFTLAGYCPLLEGSDGSAFPVFESLEHQGTFFVQDVQSDKIVDFIPF